MMVVRKTTSISDNKVSTYFQRSWEILPLHYFCLHYHIQNIFKKISNPFAKWNDDFFFLIFSWFHETCGHNMYLRQLSEQVTRHFSATYHNILKAKNPEYTYFWACLGKSVWTLGFMDKIGWNLAWRAFHGSQWHPVVYIRLQFREGWLGVCGTFHVLKNYSVCLANKRNYF